MITVYSLDRETAVARNPAQGDHAIISITTPGDPPADVLQTPRTLHVYRLRFHDLPWSDDEAARRGWQSFAIGPVTLFTENMARQIWALSLVHDELVIHCDAGVSRSGAVAVALLERWKGKLVAQHPPCPNTRVLCLMRETQPRLNVMPPSERPPR